MLICLEASLNVRCLVLGGVLMSHWRLYFKSCCVLEQMVVLFLICFLCSDSQAKGKSPPLSFHEPLLLREFFFLMASNNPGLHKMDNNPLSIQFPWEENAEGLQRWKQVSSMAHIYVA